MKYLLVLFTLWLSFLLAIDFFETPIRFSTKNLSMEQAVSIGRNLFKQLLRLEFIFLALALFQSWRLNLFPLIALLMVLGLVLAVQKFYLLPILDYRAEQLLAGEKIASSWHHSSYVVLEILKCGLLLVLVILNLKKL